jgi:hypothetical protein
MKHFKLIVLILSLIDLVVLYVSGGFFVALLFGMVSGDRPPSPQRILVGLIVYSPGLALALVALALSLVATARSRQFGWFVGLLVWPVVPILAAVLMATGAVAFPGLWWMSAYAMPLATLIYGAIGPAPLTTAAPSGAAGGVTPRPSTPLVPFLGFVGVLTLVTVLGFATLVRGAPPFSPLPAPTATVGPAVLSVRVGEGAANCAAGSYPAVTITNTLQQTVSWSAQVNDSGITVTPASGSLDAGAATTVTLSGQATTPTFFTVTFTAQGSQSLAKIACFSK